MRDGFFYFIGENMKLSKEEMKSVHQQMDAFLTSYNIKLEPPVDVYDIATELGFKISLIKSEELDGYIVINDTANNIFNIPTKKLIGVNGDLDVFMRRFIVAHEFGHFQMNANGKSMYAHRENRKGKDREEQKADFFAANILMPKKEFQMCMEIIIKELKCGYQKGLEILSEFFEAPIESVERRVKEIDEMDNTTFEQKLRNTGA